ncbi:PREDICTED: purine permease 1-like isoform X2 [Lupinus angustifolius]|uniref:purine permease 1-like isoform X2 n=1 Tax=Lupinus angustifolius TaxID=3871 RepID=UPI00092EDFE1|nr:PREDICTED: purine permease 1-like isoform X2 [Lupinus angustifolius]
MAEAKEISKEETMKRILLVLNCIIQVLGACGGPLVMRLYFIHGGSHIWLSSFLQCAGFPIMFIPLFISYIIRRHTTAAAAATTNTTKMKMFTIKLPLFGIFAIIGVLQGLDTITYSIGLSRLPVSTSALVIATQLAFTAIFAFLLVKQKFTAYSVNAIIMLILGAAVLALQGRGDKPIGESNKKYVMGFVMTLLAALLFGFIMPLIELVYKKTKQDITYSTLLAIVGMIIAKDFKAIPKEARHFGLGETSYYVLLVATAIICQLASLGAMGVIFCSSSLLSGIMVAMSIPLTEVLAVLFYKEKFQAVKGISLILSLWGFVSYFYGEFKQIKKNKKCSIIPRREQPLSNV